jgi:hypothetical protein
LIESRIPPEGLSEVIGVLGAEGYSETGQPCESYLDGPEVPEPRTIVLIPCAPGAGEATDG